MLKWVEMYALNFCQSFFIQKKSAKMGKIASHYHHRSIIRSLQHRSKLMNNLSWISNAIHFCASTALCRRFASYFHQTLRTFSSFEAYWLTITHSREMNIVLWKRKKSNNWLYSFAHNSLDGFKKKCETFWAL